MNKLPKRLGNGLTLRWATVDDIDAIADFNVNIHSDDPENLEVWLGDWTRNLMGGKHPTTNASDFTVVTDENEGGKVVSTLCTISQRWLYKDIEVKVGRPELVGTLADYRRRGLVREQMNAIHEKSELRGELFQVITGIPWYYRQFGYELALNLGGGRNFYWERQNISLDELELAYTLRPVERNDIPFLSGLYQSHNQYNMLCRIRDEQSWQYELFVPKNKSPYGLNVEIIETADSQIIGYVESQQWGKRYMVRELGVVSGVSWRPVVLNVIKRFQEKAVELKEADGKEVNYVSFYMGLSHPVYDALGNQLEEPYRPYAYYVRVPDLPKFLMHIASVLEERIAHSVLVNHSGRHRINMFKSTIELVFENGRLRSADPYTAKDLMDAHAFFPDLTFLQLLFGRSTYLELKAIYADCYIRQPETAVLFDILFPKKPSMVRALG